MPEKKFIVHSMTVEDENGVILTLDFDKYEAKQIKPDPPSKIDPGIITDFWIRSGGFVMGGLVALKEFGKKES